MKEQLTIQSIEPIYKIGRNISEPNYENLENLLARLAEACHFKWIPETLPRNNGFSEVMRIFQDFCLKSGSLIDCEKALTLKRFHTSQKNRKEEWEKLAFIMTREGEDIYNLLLIDASRPRLDVINKIGNLVCAPYQYCPLIVADKNGTRLVNSDDGGYATLSNEMHVLPLKFFHEPNKSK